MSELPLDQPKEKLPRGPAISASDQNDNPTSATSSRHPGDVSVAAPRSPALLEKCGLVKPLTARASGCTVSPIDCASPDCRGAAAGTPLGRGPDLNRRVRHADIGFPARRAHRRGFSSSSRGPQPFGTDASGRREPYRWALRHFKHIGTGAFGAISSAEQYFLMGSLFDDGTPERTDEASRRIAARSKKILTWSPRDQPRHHSLFP